MKVIAVIGARLNSSRLPAKHLLPLSGTVLIERVLQRLQQCTTLNEIILATTADHYNQPLIDWAKDKVICQAYQGNVNDLMGRINEVVSSQNADIIVYICGDCPLIDPDFIDHGVNQLINQPEAGCIELKKHIQSIHEGMHFYSRKGWNILFHNSTTKAEREHVGYANSTKTCLNSFYIDDTEDYSLVQHRISVDTVADYTFMQQVYESWYAEHKENTIVSLKWVITQLQSNKSIVAINAHVIQKQPAQNYQKISLFCHISKTIGMGHLKRCARIATTLQEYYGLGTEIHILGSSRDFIWLTGEVIWYETSEMFFISMKTNSAAGWLLDFHPEHIDTNQLRKICSIFKKIGNPFIIALDKLSVLLPVVDQLFIPSFYTELSSKKVSVGWQNYILPDQTCSNKKKQVLILTGGSDALNFGQNLPRILEQHIPETWSIKWVQGPYAKKPDIPEKNPRWHLYHNPENIQQLISDSKVIVSSYGLSFIESLQAGAATLLLPVHHLCSLKEIAALKRFNCCLVANNFSDIPYLLNSLFTEEERINQYQKKAKDLASKASGAKILGQIVCRYLENQKVKFSG